MTASKKSRNAPASPKAKSGSGSGKSSPGPGKKSSPKKSGTGAKKAAQPKTRRKKHRARPAEYVALAFFLGMALAAVMFLLMRPDTQTTDASARKHGIAVTSEKNAGSRNSLPRIAPERIRQGAKSAMPAAAPKNGSTRTASAPHKEHVSEPEDRAGTRAAQRQEEPAPPDDRQQVRRAAAENKTIAGALIDRKSLPYEDSWNVGLYERIRQVDYALIQASWLKKLPASSMRLLRIEDRREGNEPYQYQLIEILPGKSSKSYLAALRECLAAWAEGVALRQSGRDQWAIEINGVQTHLIRLYPGREDFPPFPDVPAHVEPSLEEPYDSWGKQRLRKPGEEPKLVIVVDDLGASPSALRRLMALDYPVTFAFWPHGAHTREGARSAHAAGREILVHQPMEPLGYPKVKPGPHTLLVDMSAEQIRSTLAAAIARVPHATGLNNHMGSRFTQHAPQVDTVLSVLRERGLFMLDSLTHGRSVFMKRARHFGIEHYRRNVFLDVVASRENVLAQLRQAERIALLTGQAVAIGHPLPETLSALQEWQRLRDRSVRIVRLRDLEQE